MRLFCHRRKLAELDARVAEAAEGAARATAEAEKSAQRYEAVRRHVVRPLREAAESNQFASLIRRSLTADNGGSNERQA